MTKTNHDMYISFKKVIPTPMTRGDYNQLRGWKTPEDENPEDEGYLVEYPDSPNSNHPQFKCYISWSPKDVFDRSNRPQVNQVNQEFIDAALSVLRTAFVVVTGTTTTICKLYLPNGFSIATGESACIDVNNFDEAKGRYWSHQDALTKAESKLWELSGFFVTFAGFLPDLGRTNKAFE